MRDESLLLLLDEVRAKTLHILKSVPVEHARWAPAGLQNTILWHAGHAYVLVEWLTMESLRRTPQIPDGWYEMFSWESQPARVPAERWPPLADVIHELEAQYARLRRLIGGLSEEQLDEQSARRSRRTVRSAILHALHDEACHSGEMYLLCKMQRAAKN
jgi:DinB superfamily